MNAEHETRGADQDFAFDAEALDFSFVCGACFGVVVFFGFCCYLCVCKGWSMCACVVGVVLESVG